MIWNGYDPALASLLAGENASPHNARAERIMTLVACGALCASVLALLVLV